MGAQVNTFTEGIANDLDYMVRKSSTWDFPTIGIRILNKEGQGYIATTLNSNTGVMSEGNPRGKEFALPEGFVALDVAEMNGIAYFIIHNSTTQESELGMYPSFNIGTGKWEKEYQPLQNYGGPFRTTLFGYRTDRDTELLLKESYDTSVDIYICDGHEPNRVINSGVKADGSFNNRTYSPTDFFSVLNQVPVTGHILTAELESIDTGGRLKYGNYFFYFRYLTESYQRTGIVGQLGACQVFNGNDATNRNVEGGEASQESNKKITFKLSQLDTSYSYIEIIQVRQLSDSSNLIYTEVGLIDHYYSFVSNEMIITITGNEVLSPFSEAEINTPMMVERTCYSHTQVDNTYIGANWKSPEKNSQLLAKLSLYIIPKITHKVIPGGSISPSANVISSNKDADMQYKNYFMTFDNIGYFRGEPYLITAGFLFKDGSRSNVFPIKGKDFAMLGNPENNKGVVRFPFHNVSPTHQTENKLIVIGLEFDMVEFNKQLNLQATVNIMTTAEREWFINNISGIYFARAKRKPWMKTQGLSIMGSNINKFDITKSPTYMREMIETNKIPNTAPYTFNTWDNAWSGAMHSFNMYENVVLDNLWGLDKEDKVTSEGITVGDAIMPLFKFYVPMMSVKTPNNPNNKQYGYYAMRSFPELGSYGIFSPDYMFRRNNESYNNARKIKVVGRIMGASIIGPGIGSLNETFSSAANNWQHLFESNAGAFPRTLLANMADPNSYPADTWVTTEETFGVGDGTSNRPSQGLTHKMVNVATDYETSTSDVLAIFKKGDDYYNTNRNINLKKYIGIKIDTKEFTNEWTEENRFYNKDKNLDLCIVNLYENESIEIENWYAPKTELYYDMGQPIKIEHDPITGLLSLPQSIIRFYGDCFLQRTFFKQMTWDSSRFTDRNGNQLNLCFNDAGICANSPIWANTDNVNVKTSYRHGLIIGVVTENSINTAMRYRDEDKDYYPRYGGIGWAYMPLDGRGQEAMLINNGHSESLGVRISTLWESTTPAEVNHRPTRLRYSGKHIPYSFLDGYRMFDINAYQDYDLSGGHIRRVVHYHNTLITVQDYRINEHQYGREEVTAPTSMGELILGKGDYLSPYARNLASYGTQHPKSVKVTHNGVYGVDFKKGIIWVAKGIQGQNGSVNFRSVSLSQSKLIEKWIYDLKELFGYTSGDITSSFPNLPNEMIGIVTGYDSKYNEVVFTFLNKKEIPVLQTAYNYYKEEDIYNEVPVDNYIEIKIGDVFTGGRVYMLFGDLYIATQSFTSIIESTDINDFTQFVPFNNLTFSVYDPNQLYTDEFVLFDDYTDCDVINGLINHGIEIHCGDAAVLVYITGEMLGSDICRELPNNLLITCKGKRIETVYKTLVYSEDIEAFLGEFPYASHQYFSIYNDFYSFYPGEQREEAFLHNRKGSYLLMYGSVKEALLSFIVNGISEEENLSIFEKEFNNIHIETNKGGIVGIEYRTNNQLGIKFPFDSLGIEFWSDPEWLENKYYAPVQAQTQFSGTEHSEGSQLRGTFMKVTIRLASQLMKYIKSVITEFNKSEV